VTATVSGTRVQGFEGITLDNGRVRAVVLPSLGGRVWELEDKTRRRQWIWHREAVPLASCPVGSAYDDVWAGGWEELFPNDAAGSFEGRTLPDHGEWWARSWSVTDESTSDAAILRLTMESEVVAATCVKEIRLPSDGSKLSIHYSIRSLESRSAHFLFKQHLPIAIDSECRLALPGGRAETVDSSFSKIANEASAFDWPRSGQNDLRVIPPRTSQLREFLYLRDLPDGWCGVDDRRSGAALRMRFSTAEFPFVWLFLTYGGGATCIRRCWSRALTCPRTSMRPRGSASPRSSSPARSSRPRSRSRSAVCRRS